MRWLVITALAACGRFDFRDRAITDGPQTADLGVDTAPCTFGPFSAPQPLPGPANAGNADDWSPSVTADDLTLYFYSLRGASPDIFIATRADATQSFSVASVVTELSSAATDHFPRTTADDLEMFMTSDRVTANQVDIYLATRADRASPWGTPVAIAELNTAFIEEGIAVSADGLRVMFSSNRAATTDLYSAERPDRAAAFTNLRRIAELDAGGVEYSPTLSSDELELFYVTDRPGGTGAFDIWRATRPAIGQPFDPPTPVTELNSTGDEYAPYLSFDGTHIFFSYNAPITGSNTADIWFATRSCM